MQPRERLTHCRLQEPLAVGKLVNGCEIPSWRAAVGSAKAATMSLIVSSAKLRLIISSRRNGFHDDVLLALTQIKASYQVLLYRVVEARWVSEW